MKFLCGNCKAKYQIADEKVSGRTLRMKCRRCGHDILIDGHSMPQSVPPSPATAPRRTGSSTVSVMPGPGRGGSGSHAAPVPRAGTAPGLPRPAASRSKPPSGLSADFRRHVAAPPEVPQRSAPYDLWHVAIQDVPVGPMTRDELSRKIDAGAVTPESLCWREGMDDWRPLGDLPELAQLLRRTREPVRPGRARPPPSVPASASGSHGGSRSAPLPTPPFDELQDEEGGEATRISEFTPPVSASAPLPLFPPAQPQQATPAPAPRGFAPPPAAAAQAAVQQAAATPQPNAPLPSVETQAHVPAPRGPGLTVSGGIAVGLLAGILLLGGPMMYQHFWGGYSAKQEPSEQTTPAAKVEAPRPPAPVAEPTLEIPDEEPAPDDKAAAPVRTPARTNKPAVAKPETTEKPVKQLSDEQRKLIERMGGGSSNDPDLSRVGGNRGEQSVSGPVAAALTPAQLNKVVQDNKSQLQRCYETALRAAGGKQDAAIKITVNVVVGSSGTTKSVSTQGDGLGNMTDCIRGAVKRWRFPQSGGESEIQFPLVFQPGA
jgi:predicted Zn finger-like uncharacterized protein